ncbi:unnamed protein product [Rotaria sp. Silwood2]|nr:unnamed protein product [Rotaria sp. Silwood2]CAF2878512.1 unnamed protein product [Rotaria sp. Silwood2]CAF3224351.1 unnamed protein product [Rotaria sp. Silwood2]CAF3327912.1 unnamed protein product [Rotaria sp. Silwood2]CAF3857355.1 unnamed protein product [Rotaria sp. Silwood2]
MGNKPEHIKAIFILGNDKSKVNQRDRFDNGEDLICQLADELYRCYKKEANDFFISGDLSMAKSKENQADRIYRELKRIHESFFEDDKNIKGSISTTTKLVWLKSKFQNDTEVKQMESLFSTFVSSFQTFDSEVDCQNYLLESKSNDAVFLIINADYRYSLTDEFQQLSNVKFVYLYEESSLKNDTVISNYNNLRFRLTYDLIGYYKKLGNDCSANQDAKTAKDMATKARELCNILAEL